MAKYVVYTHGKIWYVKDKNLHRGSKQTNVNFYQHCLTQGLNWKK